MAIETDPKLVREIAETAFRSDAPGSAADRVEAALIASGVAGPVLSKKFDAYTEAVGAEYERLADVHAVRAVVDAAGALPIPQFESMPKLAAALNALLEQFEDRIKAVDEAESVARVRAFKAKLGERGE